MSIQNIMILITLVFVVAIGYIACSIISPSSCNPSHNIKSDKVKELSTITTENEEGEKEDIPIKDVSKP